MTNRINNLHRTPSETHTTVSTSPILNALSKVTIIPVTQKALTTVTEQPTRAAIPTFPRHAEIYEKMRGLARFAMHNPSEEAKQLVRDALTNFGNLITRYSLTSKDLKFIFDAASESRSEYTEHHTPSNHERNAKLRNLIYTLTHFNHVRNFDEHFEKYANALESLNSGLAYRAIGSSVKKDGVQPASVGIRRLLDDINQKGYLPAHIKTEFPHRQSDDASRSIGVLSIEIPQNTQDPIEGGLPGPQPGPCSRKFALNSYVVKAMSKNIPMRAHVSGTMPLTLAALHYVMNNGREKGRMNELSLVRLGGIVTATYALGDFHSIAETAAGIAHFYQLNVENMRFSNQNAQILEQVKPKTYYALSFGFLSSMVRSEALPQFNEMTQDLIEDYIEDVPLKVSVEQALPQFNESIQGLIEDYTKPSQL